MQRVLGWVAVLVLCSGTGVWAGEEPTDARLPEARTAYAEAQALHAAGRYAEALARGEHALELLEAVFGDSHPAVATCLGLLGGLHATRGDFDRAETLLQRALAIEEPALGKNHPNVAGTLHNLALLYTQQGQYSRAEPLYERALAIHEVAQGKNHPDVARTLAHLAALYLEQRQYGRAEPLLERALAIQEEALGQNHREVARTLGMLALVYRGQGHYSRAEPLYERALPIQEAALGARHPDIAKTLAHIATLQLEQGQYGRAEPLLERALAIQEDALGQHHHEVARTLGMLAIVYKSQGQYGRAVPLLERALSILEAALGERHPDVARALHNLGLLYGKQGQYSRAEPLLERALAIHEVAQGKSHPDVASSLMMLADIYRGQGQYTRAEPLYERALPILEAALGEDHPGIARALAHFATLLVEQGQYGRAAPLLERALAIQEGALGQNHPDVAKTLNDLASAYKFRGQYGQAEPLYVRAVAIKEEALGKNHLDVAPALNNLASLYQEQGLYGRAEPLLERSIAISEEALGKNHPDVVLALNNLALLYKEQGMYSRAELLHERALATQEASLGKDHPSVATSLNNLAVLHHAQRRYAQAEPLYERALAIKEAALGRSHPTVAQLLHNLALIYSAQGQYSRAERLHGRSRAISEGALGKSHPVVATSLISLADLYWAQGQYGRAESLHERALPMLEAALGKNHPTVAAALNSLALVKLARHRLDAAVPLLTRAFAISEQRLRHEALGLSEARLAGLLQLLRNFEENLYELLRRHPDNARVRHLALSAALLLKGRSVGETANVSHAVSRSLGTEERDTFERLRGLRTQLAGLSLQDPGSLPPAAYQQRLQALAEQGDALEADLARRSAPLRALAALPAPADIVGRVAQALPRDAALVELITYETRPLVPGASGASPHLRYLALVLFPDASIRTVDLGPAEPIDSAASRLRDALANRDATFQAQAQALYQLAFKPLLPLLGRTRRLFLSPDGQLALVPFAALHDGRGFLVDSFDFTYLTSGKELLPRAQQPIPASSVVVLADPDFRAPLPAASMSAERSSSFSTRDNAPARRDWRLVSLPGTRQEAQAIQRLLPQAQLFLGADATKQRLLQLPAPGILHLATHGFFLEDAPAPAQSRAAASFGTLGDTPQAHRPPDPLLRSGLLFAGANAPASSSPAQPPPDTALATALELAGLDLWGTQLVVLSACDTGRGDVKLGQGVHGLRRALVVAGAETVVMSLWKVNDDTTRQLMEAYYQKLLEGRGRATALREAMLELRKTQPHPHDWAPFIALGQDAPLHALGPESPEAAARPRVAILGARRQAGVAAVLQQLDGQVITDGTSGMDLAGVWKVLGNASGAVLLVDAAEGPTQRLRDHLLLARQAGFNRLPMVLWHANDLLALDDGRERLGMELDALKAMYRQYMDDAEAPEVRSDVATPATRTLEGGDLTALLGGSRSPPDGLTWFTDRVSVLVYVLAEGEAENPTTLVAESKVGLLLDGHVVEAAVTGGRLAPGELGVLELRFAPRLVRRLSRFGMLQEGALVAAGNVMTEDDVSRFLEKRATDGEDRRASGE